MQGTHTTVHSIDERLEHSARVTVRSLKFPAGLKYLNISQTVLFCPLKNFCPLTIANAVVVTETRLAAKKTENGKLVSAGEQFVGQHSAAALGSLYG